MNSILHYSPIIIVIMVFFIQQRIIVTPEQLEKKHREILEDAEEKGLLKEGSVIIECEVPKDKTVVYRFSDGKIRTSELRVLREVPLEELGTYGKIVAKKRKKGGGTDDVHR